jgi:hypothetical protein
LNNELSLLRELGCYADFTLPAVPSPAQTRLVNTIYWATDNPFLPRSHDAGDPVTVGGAVMGDLLIIPGPLGLNWEAGRRPLPRTENGELACYSPCSLYRARLWLRLAPRIGSDIFLKLFAHGAQERHSSALLDGILDETFACLRAVSSELGCSLHYVSPWEMYNVIESIRQRRDPLRKTVPTPDSSASQSRPTAGARQ